MEAFEFLDSLDRQAYDEKVAAKAGGQGEIHGVIELPIWVFPKQGGTPKSSILIGFCKPFILGYPGTPIFWQYQQTIQIHGNFEGLHIYGNFEGLPL